MYSHLFESTNLYKKLLAKDLVEILIKADKAYHLDGKEIISDKYYDLLKVQLRKRASKNPYFKKVGFKPPDKIKIKLPYYLGSQNKYHYEDSKELNKWFDKYKSPEEYYISEKLDGISCLIITDKDGNYSIYTRGDGVFGIDITYIKDYIKTIPKNLPNEIAVRGELLLSKANWDTIKDEGANARNVVAGVINSKSINEKILPLIDFIAYDYINDRRPLNDGMKILEGHGFKIAMNKLVSHKMNVDELLEELVEFRKTSDYEIDGIVITHNKSNKLENGKNPEYSFAFKSNSLLDYAEVVVNDIEWNVSKDRYLKPVVIFNPVILEGVSIKRATGFNADFIVKHKIGIGSIIKIQRSGGVIPDIIEVLKEADNNEPLMPKVPYIWNKTKIDILIEGDEKNREQDIKTFSFFMKSLKIKGVSEGIITKLYDNSYDTIYKIINITKEDVLKLDGFKEKSAVNLIEALEEIKMKTCKEIMNASNLLGRGIGEKKLELIFTKYPFICIDKKRALELTIEDLKQISGMGDITSKQFIDNLNKFFEFYEELGFKEDKEENFFEGKYFLFIDIKNKDYNDIIIKNNGFIEKEITKNTNYIIIKNYEKLTTEKINSIKEKGIKIITEDEFIKNITIDIKYTFFQDKYFVFTGFRNKEYEDIIKSNGGFINDGITKNTNYLVIKNYDKITEKIKKAKEKGIEIITEDEFKQLL